MVETPDPVRSLTTSLAELEMERGQVIRLLVAAPGSALGRYPEGNTGRARVPLTQPMPIPDDLADILAAR